jgi:hypothetical protein
LQTITLVLQVIQTLQIPPRISLFQRAFSTPFLHPFDGGNAIATGEFENLSFDVTEAALQQGSYPLPQHVLLRSL